MGDKLEYYLLVDEQTQGPYPLSQVQAMFDQKQITAHTLFTVPGENQWYPLSKLMLPPTPVNISLPEKKPLSSIARLCANCGQIISKSVAKCPHCGQRYTSFSLKLLAVLLLIGVGMFCYDYSKELNDPARAAQIDKSAHLHGAYRAGIEFVKKTLKAPSSAEFPDYDTETVGSQDKGNGYWMTWGFVDAQNNFGAKLRSRWWVEMRLEDGKYS